MQHPDDDTPDHAHPGCRPQGFPAAGADACTQAHQGALGATPGCLSHLPKRLRICNDGPVLSCVELVSALNTRFQSRPSAVGKEKLVKAQIKLTVAGQSSGATGSGDST